MKWLGKAAIAGALMTATLATMGCAARTRDAATVRQDEEASLRHDRLLLTDDMELIWLTDRRTRLTKWNVE